MVRGVRNCGAAFADLRGRAELLQLRVENTLAPEQPVEAGVVEQHRAAGRRLAELRVRRRQQRGFRDPAKGERRAERADVFAQHGGHAEPVLGGVSGRAERIPAGQFLAGGSGRRGAQRAGGSGARWRRWGFRITTRRRGS